MGNVMNMVEKNVLVTGVASGIGLGITRFFAARGWSVYGLDKDLPPGDAPLERFVQQDLAALEELPPALDGLLGGVDGLTAAINCAAVQVTAPFVDIMPKDFRHLLDVNLVAPLVVAQATAARLCRARGAIVNVASVHALSTSPQMSAYAASKGGLVALTRGLALELAPSGVRVNAVLPGAVDTPMLSEGLARALASDEQAATVLEAFGKRHPLGRVGRPEDIARAVFYLADPEESSFVTGSALVVDGGVLARLSTEGDF